MKKVAPAVLEQRVKALRSVLASDPADEVALFVLGKALLDLGRPAEAESALRRLVEIRPAYTAAYRELGRALLLAGKAREARRVLEQGCAVAEQTGDLQTGREMQVLVRRAQRALEESAGGN
jgi:Flp pilus assembly protein TadD